MRPVKTTKKTEKNFKNLKSKTKKIATGSINSQSIMTAKRLAEKEYL